MNDENDTSGDGLSMWIRLHSANWYAQQATDLINEWKNCRTENARKLLIPKLEHIYRKLAFERNGIKKILIENGYDDQQ